MSKKVNVGLVVLISFFVPLLFVGLMTLNNHVKKLESVISAQYKEINDLRTEIKRMRIEISALTNPLETHEFIEENKYKPVKVENVINVEIE